jgi:hypothetical protein
MNGGLWLHLTTCADLYYKPVPLSSDELYTAYAFYGSRRMARQFQREGKVINHIVKLKTPLNLY